MKRFLLFLAGAITATASFGAIAPGTETANQQSEIKRLRYSQMQNGHKAVDATGNLVDVKIVVNMSGDEYRFDEYFPLLAIGEPGYAQLEEYKANPTKTQYTGTMSLPAGTFDFIASFKHVNLEYTGGFDHLSKIILENVTISEGAVVTISPADATNKIIFKTVNPDGTPTKLTSRKYIDEDYNSEVVNEGNVSSMTIISTLTNRDFGMIDCLGRGASVFEPTEVVPYRTDGERYMDIYVNDVSDRYEFRQVRLMNGMNDKLYNVVLHTYGSPDGELTLSNNASDYFIVNNKFAGPSWTDNLDPEKYEQKYTVFFDATEANGHLPMGNSLGHVLRDANFSKVYACTGLGADDTPLSVLQFERTIIDKNTDDEYVDSTPWIFLIDAANSWYGAFENSVYESGEGGKYGKWYPGHPALGYTMDMIPDYLLATAPVIHLGYAEDWNSRNQRDLMLFSYNILNQTFDNRGSDKKQTTVSLKYNGAEVLNGADLEWEWPYDWVGEEHEPGEYLLRVEDTAFSYSETNVKTVAEMSFNTGRADYSAPVIQGFQVRNTDGRFASVLDKPSDGELRIVGGDFNMQKSYVYEDGYYDVWYNIDNVDLKVEYAIHETEDFKELGGLQEMEDTYWGFGQYWKAPLSGMENAQEQQWYDVRVTLTDASGNFQRRLFSPAFYITSASGISSGYDDNINVSVIGDILKVDGFANPSVSIFSTDGQTVFSGNGDSVSLSMLDKGIYIINVKDATQSKTIKIVR